MNCEQCNDTGWIVTERGAKRCPHFAERQATPRTPIDGRSLAMATRGLGAIGFFPRDQESQTIIGDALAAMCPNVEALRYVVRRATELYQVWDRCGIQGLRQIVSYRYLPADGISIYGSSEFPEGLPPDPKSNPPAALPAGVTLQLPAGNESTADTELEQKIRTIAAKSPRLSGTPLPDDKTTKRLRAIITPPQEREELPMETHARGISLMRRAEIEAQIAEVLREKRERGQ